jgi:putative aldouronate transport system substrate-binding protein
MKINRRIGISAASVAITGLALTACGAGGGGGADNAAETKHITWMTVVHTPAVPEPGSPVEAALEEHTGYDIDFQWVPAANANEKLTAAIASDKLADVVTLGGLDGSVQRSALQSGQFWDIEEYLKDYPNLSKIDPQTIEAAKLDGHLYGVPMQKFKARYGVLVRQDWLDTLGLEVPHTIDDLAEVARAFTNDDPDGNGKDDTTGFIDRLESFDLGYRSLSGYFGAGSVFELDDDDNIVASFSTDAFKEGMEWYRGLYEEGAVNNEFVTVQKQNQYDAIAQGKGGIMVTGLFEATNLFTLAQSSNPDTPMAWAQVNDMTYKDVPRRILSDTNGGVGGWYAIPKSQVKTEEELKTVLDVLDKMSDEESFSLMTNGIEGEHFEFTESGEVEVLDSGTFDQQVQPFLASRMSEKTTFFPSTQPYVNSGNEMMSENDQYAITNPAQSLTSPAFDKLWTTVQQDARDAYNKYMVGQIDMADYEKVVDNLRQGDLGTIEAEFTAAYAEVNG